MKNLISSAILTFAACALMVAAPAPKKAQAAASQPAAQTAPAKVKNTRKHVKKANKGTAASTNNSAPAK